MSRIGIYLNSNQGIYPSKTHKRVHINQEPQPDNMDILRYITEELPRKRLQGLNKQLEYLKQPLASTASEARLQLANYYITNHKSEFFTLYQAGKEVDISQLSSNPRALTLIKSKTSGNTQWVTVDSQSNRVPSIQNMTAKKALMYMSQNFAFEGLTSKKR